PDVQREPGHERVPVLRRPLRPEGRCDRSVGGAVPVESAASGAGPDAHIQPQTSSPAGNGEEERLSTVESMLVSTSRAPRSPITVRAEERPTNHQTVRYSSRRA